MKIIAEVIRYDDFDEDETSKIIISGADDNQRTIFSFEPEYAGTEKDWKYLSEACQTPDKYYSLNHDVGNGDCSIDVGKEEVTFVIARYGTGVGGLYLSVLKRNFVLKHFSKFTNHLRMDL
jgi:hypothetical protein